MPRTSRSVDARRRRAPKAEPEHTSGNLARETNGHLKPPTPSPKRPSPAPPFADSQHDRPAGRSLDDLLGDGGQWSIVPGHGGRPVILVGLASPATALPATVPCEMCEGTMCLEANTRSFRLDRLGVVLRFRNRLLYVCPLCDHVEAPADDPQGLILGDVLDFTTWRLDSDGLRSMSPSPEALVNSLRHR